MCHVFSRERMLCIQPPESAAAILAIEVWVTSAGAVTLHCYLSFRVSQHPAHRRTSKEKEPSVHSPLSYFYNFWHRLEFLTKPKQTRKFI